MLKTYLATASVAAMLATGAMAQTAAPAPTAPAAPAQTQTQTAPSNTTMTRAANEQLTTRKIVGISLYAPKPGSTATTGSTAAPAAPAAPAAGNTAAGTAGSMASGSSAGGQMMITPVSDEQWRTMRDQHDSIGEINDLVVGADGRITHAVLGVGGFLGIGEKNVALPLNQVRLMRQSDGTLIGFVTSTKAQLQEMPNFTATRS
jgi:hypothetical protein